MKAVADLRFHDLVGKCDAYAGVRSGRGAVAIVLSLESNGDTELCVTPQVARELAAALEAAAKRAEDPQR